MSKRIKHLMAGELAAKLEGRDSCVLVAMGRLDVESVTGLRSQLREQGVQLTVLKNRVAAHAMRDSGLSAIVDRLSGPSALAYGEGGAINASRILAEWEKKAPEGLEIRGGILEGRVLEVEDVRELATIPEKPVLYSMLASSVVAPLTQVLTLTNEILAGVARGVDAMAKKRGEAEAA